MIIDLHPNYPSSIYGSAVADEKNIPVEKVQHHQAHFAALLGELNLVHNEEPILGVIWDGTGLGTDGQIWGGEFFIYQDYAFERVAHWSYFPLISGDRMAKEPRMAALSICKEIKAAHSILMPKFSSTEWQVYNRMLEKSDTLKTSSMGRVFDAVASLLGILDRQTFEGHAAMLLENRAYQYLEQTNWNFSGVPYSCLDIENHFSLKTLFEGIISDLQNGEGIDFIAAKFHWSLAIAIRDTADRLLVKKVAFSGGVFQNSVLVDLLQILMKPQFDLYFHQQLSPNDENISFGQLVAIHIKDLKTQLTQLKTKANVPSHSREDNSY